MLLGLIEILPRDPGLFLSMMVIFVFTWVLALLMALTIHEFSHAMFATRLGDTTAKELGRLSLNPLVHLDPVGTFALLFIGLGWGKPVPVNVYRLRRPDKFRGMSIVAIAGPLANIAAAAFFAILVRLGITHLVDPFSFGLSYYLNHPGEYFSALVTMLLFFNAILAALNLIPIAPLDGSKILLGLVPNNIAVHLARWEPYGVGILLLVFFLDFFMHIGLLWGFVRPVANGIVWVFLGQPLL